MRYTYIQRKESGFTLIELLVVISIIGVLSSVVLTSLNKAKGEARDAVRKSDLTQIRTALYMYHDDKGDFVQTNSGCGWGGKGNGWFNFNRPPYPDSIVQCLIDVKALNNEIIDPTKGIVSTPTKGYTYMKYSCVKGTYLYAKLEGKPQSATATDGTCCQDCDERYGMNYFLKI